MAAVISNEPRRIELSIIDLPKRFDESVGKVCQAGSLRLQRKKQAKLGFCLFYRGWFPVNA
ncbi:hypothetical protein PkP19E3_12515 [Pseudomonas koreensis]|nr:hypothetical protein PkP19E3_12515 [Pseudomonas koreensis]